MPVTKTQCPKCKNKISRRVLKLTRGKCPKCGFNLASSLTKFATARSRIKTKYRK